MGKVVTVEELNKIISSEPRKTIVFTNGCFDLIHPGHIRYLTEAKALGDTLVIGLNSDVSVKKIKGENRPIIDEKGRIEILSSIRPVDFILLFDEETPVELIRKLEPDIYVKGKEYERKKIPEVEIVDSYGGRTVFLDMVKGYSTTGLVKRILKIYGQ